MTQLPIQIPLGYKVSVEKDQKISQGDVIASSSEEVSQDLIVHIASDLGVNSSEVEKILTKHPGERIEIGDLIAKKGGMLGSREIHSKVSGTLLNLNSQDGTISIKADEGESKSEVKNITSPVDGEVELCDNDKVVLKTDKEAILAEASSGDSGVGEVFISDKDDLIASDIDEKVSKKILVARKIERDAVAKAIGLSAFGIIGQEISDDTFENLKSKKVQTPVLKVSEENFRKIAKKNEKLMLDSANLVIIKL